jgi:tetratricopeptide (TPR) repeat protein
MTYVADSLLRAERFAAAESAFAAVIAADSLNSAGHAGRAQAILDNPWAGPRRAEALAELRTALRLAPGNGGLHLQYGEALLPWRQGSPSADDSAQLVQAVYHLQRALAITPGRAEPHMALYLVWLALGKSQQAEAELRQLLDKHLFPQPVLDFAYDLLISVDSGGHVFTNGDIDTYPLLALQVAQGLRPDVTVVNIPLLNVAWYVKYLKRARGLPVSFSDSLIAGLEPKYDERLERTLSPGLRVLYDAIANRARSRGSFYFALTVDREIMEPLKSRLSLEGFLYRLTRNRADIPVNRERCNENLTRNYRIPEFAADTSRGRLAHGRKPSAGKRSSLVRSDAHRLAQDCAAAFYALAAADARRGETARATGLLRRACSILTRAGCRDAFEKVLAYWLKIAPDDPDALRLKREGNVK